MDLTIYVECPWLSLSFLISHRALALEEVSRLVKLGNNLGVGADRNRDSHRRDDEGSP